ncbi:Glutamine--fructose-6-phosphate aminotransferase [isomerizing] [uncultured archaeon]|nr:Glutamine--fructose-6-phosphate aminotransferase [isomerizing] [uncultured archaeon]
MGEVKEECGVCGIYLKNSKDNSALVPVSIDLMLSAIQRRGQSGTGVGIFKSREGEYSKPFAHRKKLLNVENFFGGEDNIQRELIVDNLKGVAGIGHVRYGTSGKRDNATDQLQPFLRRHGKKSKRFCFCFNGNLANYPELEQDLLKSDYDLEIGVDTEIIMHLISLRLKFQQFNSGENFEPDFFDIARSLMEKLDGAYSLLMLMGNGDLGVVRDPQGFKPLVWGENEDFYAVASETNALRQVGIKNFKIVEPGSVILFSKTGVKVAKIFNTKKAHCHFEAVYFENDTSHFENIPVHDIRWRFGLELAKVDPLAEEIRKNPRSFVIFPAPETANLAARAFASHFNLTSEDVLKKISSKRGFINSKEKRAYLMNRIYDVVPHLIKDKKAILIEDSVVRGETLKKIVKLLKEACTKEIHIRVTDPPIKCPCFYGIDMSTYSELIANKYPQDTEKNIAKEMEVDSFKYQTIDGLKNSLLVAPENLCLACLNGEYPTEFGKKRAQTLLKNSGNESKVPEKIYDRPEFCDGKE